MARGQRRTIEEKILQKEEIIQNLKIRLEHEQEELNELLSVQKQQEVEILYDFLKSSNLNVQDATEILQQHINSDYVAAS